LVLLRRWTESIWDEGLEPGVRREGVDLWKVAVPIEAKSREWMGIKGGKARELPGGKKNRLKDGGGPRNVYMEKGGKR